METYQLLLVALCLGGSLNAESIFTKDFEDGVNPGMIDGTSTYAEITRYLEAEGSGHHARFDFTVPSEPVEGASWSGGLSTRIGNFVSLPPVWRLSFRVATSAPTPEPLRIKFSFYTKPKLGRRDPAAEGITATLWITPSGTGWQDVVLNSDEAVFSMGTFVSARTSEEPDTFLAITAHSRGPSGESLSLSTSGDHFLLLDDIDFRIPVSPFVAIQARPDGKLSLFYTGTLHSGENLVDWETLLVQPDSHTIIDPTHPRRFYMATTN